MEKSPCPRRRLYRHSGPFAHVSAYAYVTTQLLFVRFDGITILFWHRRQLCVKSISSQIPLNLFEESTLLRTGAISWNSVLSPSGLGTYFLDLNLAKLLIARAKPSKFCGVATPELIATDWVCDGKIWEWNEPIKMCLINELRLLSRWANKKTD